MKNNIIASVLLFGTFQGLQAQITVDDTMTPQQLVEQVLVGQGVQVFNVTYNGQASAPAGQAGLGSFTSTSSLLPLDSGLVLSSGGVTQIPSGAPYAPGSGAGSDADLVQLSGQSINDKSILEFDFIPNGDTISFSFVFSSTEYSNYTCTQFNDAFGFFLSGPGITGPFSNNATNLAVVPNTSIPITINTINSGSPTGGGNAATCAAADPNWQANSVYYVNNPTTQDFIFNGTTIPLLAQAPVICGETYHIKLAIGDGSDSALDSGVFLEGGSFTSSPFIPTLTPGPGIVGTNTILESCYDVTLDFVRTGDSTLASVVHIAVSGTATAGVDYLPEFPDSLVFPAGVGSIPFTFNAPMDADGTETLVIELTSYSTCASMPITNIFEFIIETAPPLEATGYDLNIQCGDEAMLAPDITGGFVPYTVDWSNGMEGDSIGVSPTQITTYTATITDTCGTSTNASFTVGLIELPPLVMNIIGSGTLVEGCESSQINVIRPMGVPGDLTIALSSSGTADGQDVGLPLSVVIPDGNFNALVPFDPIDDAIDEGNETMMVIGTFTDDCGRTVDAAVNFTIVDAPAITIEGEDIWVACEEADSMLISVTAAGGYNDQLMITWGDSAITGASFWAPVLFTTSFTATATDPCGRSASTTIQMIVDCEIIVPNVFSPNNDGMNDLWHIEGIQYTKNTVKVYNRWGQVVFEANNYRNNWRAQDIPDGTYFYEIIVERHEEPYIGHLTILAGR